MSVPVAAAEQQHPDPAAPSPVRGFSSLIAANVSFIVAVMVYMGWAYENALYSYFHLNPAELGFSVQEYLLAIANLFNPVFVIGAVALIAFSVTWTRGGSLAGAAVPTVRDTYVRLRSVPEVRWLDDTLRRQLAGRLPKPPEIPDRVMHRLRDPRVMLGVLGALLTACALAVAFVAQHAPVNTYVLLGLLAAGPLMLTRAARGNNRAGIFPYTLAVVVTGVCILWAGALYANGLGTRAAQGIATSLAGRTAVAVYTVQPLALSGPGVIVQKLPAGYLYHYRYEGLRLLYMSSGTYYLLPQGWIPQLDLTYVLNSDDQTMFELYSGVQRTSYGS